jgi:hypothetical protein
MTVASITYSTGLPFMPAHGVELGGDLRRCLEDNRRPHTSRVKPTPKAPQHHDLSGSVCARGDIVDLRGLHVHAAHCNNIGPFGIGGRCARDVSVDEAHRPSPRKIGGDQQQALRRHEGAHALHQAIGVIERIAMAKLAKPNPKDRQLLLDAST